MMNAKVLKAMNEQINKELYSSYLYLGMSVKMQEANYKGLSHWLYQQSREELEHAGDFINFIQKRDAQVELKDVKFEACTLTDPLEVAKAVLEHERKVSASINALTELVQGEKDHATEIFLHKYVNEQIEEEDSAQDIIDMFEFAGESTAARYAVDVQLGQRA